MKKTQYLTQLLASEANEVAIACNKANMFGLDNIYIGSETTKEHLIYKLNHLTSVVKMLINIDILPRDWVNEGIQLNHINRIIEQMRISRELKMLDPQVIPEVK